MKQATAQTRIHRSPGVLTAILALLLDVFAPTGPDAPRLYGCIYRGDEMPASAAAEDSDSSARRRFGEAVGVELDDAAWARVKGLSSALCGRAPSSPVPHASPAAVPERR